MGIEVSKTTMVRRSLCGLNDYDLERMASALCDGPILRDAGERSGKGMSNHLVMKSCKMLICEQATMALECGPVLAASGQP